MKNVWVVLYEDDESPLIYLYATETSARRKAQELRDDRRTVSVTVYEQSIEQ